MDSVFFSVIVPSHNRAHSIEKAIKSILTQTFQDFEIIVVDDASTDRTGEVVNLFSDDRIFYIRNEVNLERCVSRNQGITHASGEYICFLDSDDYHLPNHLENIHAEIVSKQYPVAFFFTNSWNETTKGVRTERACPDYSLEDPFTYFLRHTVNPQRWAVHKSIFDHHKFDPNIVICEDMDTSLRIAQAGFPIYQIKERTTVYVAAPDSFTFGDPRKWEKELFYLKRIFNRKELNGCLSKIEKRRLLSMCYYHLAIKQFGLNAKLKVFCFGMKSFILYPKGYNGVTNKSLFVMICYSIPFCKKLSELFFKRT
jgi:glycosyltransferase involved in cell wall biosynthesis